MNKTQIKKSGCLLSVVAALNSHSQVLADTKELQSKFVSPRQDIYGEYILSKVVREGQSQVNDWEFSKGHEKGYEKSFSKTT